uniref:BTB domain-containing protein n=1 Tax=Caenorhabditis japonica TaxID=281687 RepID=A0A8R1DQU6_CAEJA
MAPWKIVYRDNEFFKVPNRNSVSRKGSIQGLEWIWTVTREHEDYVSMFWNFQWPTLRASGVTGFEGTVSTREYIERKFESSIVMKEILLKKNDGCSFDLILRPILNVLDDARIESIFSSSKFTDVVLLVQGKKMNVNKGFLSFHSPFFHALFSSNFKENSMNEIPIVDVGYKEFAELLSSIYPNAIPPTSENVVNLMKLADRFQMEAVTNICESIVLHHPRINFVKKLAIADKYNLESLMEFCIKMFETAPDPLKMLRDPEIKNMTPGLKSKLFDKFLEITRE